MRHATTYRCIDAIVRTGSIRRAASDQSITGSALNRRLIAVEQELGVQLFERTTRGLRLNTAGELAIAHIRDHLSAIDVLKSRIADVTGVRAGHVRIACTQALLRDFLPDVIQPYIGTHPAVRFSVMQIEAEQANERLLNYDVDVAVAVNRAASARVTTLAQIGQSLDAIMAPDHPLAEHTRLRLHECLAYPLALPLERFGTRSLLEAAAERLGLPMRPVIESDDFGFLARCVERSRRISFRLSCALADRRPPSALVSAPVVDRAIRGSTISVMCLKGRHLSVAASQFVASLIRALERLC